MEEEDKQLYRRPQMTGHVRDDDEEEDAYNNSYACAIDVHQFIVIVKQLGPLRIASLCQICSM